MHLSYGNTGCRVFKWGVQSKKDFWELMQWAAVKNLALFYEFILSKNVNNKKCAPKLALFNEKKGKRFDIEN